MSLESSSFKPSAVLVVGPEASWGEKGICQASINRISEKHVKDYFQDSVGTVYRHD